MSKGTSEKIFYVIGLSYKKADVTIRSNFSLSVESKTNLLKDAKASGIKNVMVISTCNRTEIIGFAKHPYELISLLCKHSKGTVDEFAKVSYVYKNADAITHFIRIATGLDSQIIGDYEIVNQLKNSFQLAKKANTIDAFMERLYNVSLQASKEVKNKTSLSSGTTSVSYAAIQYIKNHFSDLKNTNILIYGLGKIGESTARSGVSYLSNSNLSIINRTEKKAEKLANELEVSFKKEENLEEEIQASDIVIVATGASKPTVTKDLFSTSKKQLVIDLSIPRNAEQSIAAIAGKTVVDVDLLSNTTKDTFDNRMKQVPLVEKIIEKHKNEFFDWLMFRKSTPAINTLKNSLENIQKDAITLHSKKFDNLNVDHTEEVTSFIVNKIVSKFAAHLKDENAEADLSIQVMEQVFK